MANQIKAFFTRIILALAFLILGFVIKDELVGFILLTIAAIMFAAHLIKKSERKGNI